MSNYRKFIATKVPKVTRVDVVPSIVSDPIQGREAEMIPSSGGAGYAFKSAEVNQYKRWLVFGSAGSTMYANSNDITVQSLEVVSYMLSNNYKLALDILQDFSVRNVVKGQKTLLTVLSLALAYDDKTVRVYKNVNMSKLNIDELTNDDCQVYTFSDTVHRVSFSNDRNILYAMIYDKKTNGNYRYEAYILSSNSVLTVIEEPVKLKWY